MTLFKILVLMIASIGHGAFWVACFNRINATGLPRKIVKRSEKIFVITCLVLPPLIVAIYGGTLFNWALDRPDTELPTPLWIYGLFCLLAISILLPMFLYARMGLRRSATLAQNVLRQLIDVRELTSDELYGKNLARRLAMIPGNQIGHVEFTQKELPIVDLPPALDGLHILHLSDLHLTGEMTSAFYESVIPLACQKRPDLCVLTGDIIDFEEYIDWLPTVLRDVNPLHGKFFLLGNHDKRIERPEMIRESMISEGWHDIGTSGFAMEINDCRVELIGNEQPWFPNNPHNQFCDTTTAEENVMFGQPDLEIAASHSPDQFGWAVSEQSHLLLAGHTHGGQIRLPWIGPFVAPSWHGSRYASGVFRKSNTTMHVSRGLGGIHPIRFNCPPEIATLILRCET